MGKRGKELAKERRKNRLEEISRLRQIPIATDQRWWTPKTVAVVTGSNRGIGYEIARQLASQGLGVVLTTRDTDRGMEAVEGLHKEGLSNVNFHQLDVTDEASITGFAEWVRLEYGGLDILRICDASLREQLGQDACLSEALIDGMVRRFLDEVKDGSWEHRGWPQMFTDYSVSKLAVNAFTRLVAREVADRAGGQKIHVNCYCPGWVKTTMTGWAGNMTAEEGADTGVWAVLLPGDQLLHAAGKFFAERREISF